MLVPTYLFIRRRSRITCSGSVTDWADQFSRPHLGKPTGGAESAAASGDTKQLPAVSHHTAGRENPEHRLQSLIIGLEIKFLATNMLFLNGD